MGQAMLSTAAGQEYIDSETVRPGTLPVTAQSSNEEIHQRIRTTGMPHVRLSGGAAMSTVVDSPLRVIGVKGLRVANSSVFPIAIGVSK